MTDDRATARRRKVPPDRKPHEGPGGERQMRLPGISTGHFGGGSAAFEPENWAERPPGGGRIAAFHSSMQSGIPRYDSPEEARGADSDEDVDPMGRPMAVFGSAIGIHLGSLEAAMTAGRDRPYVHVAAIKASKIQRPYEADQGTFFMRTEGGGDTEMTADESRWSDAAANYSPQLTDYVEAGKVIPYRNTVEDIGSTSFRGKPEALETWSEQVLHSNLLLEAGRHRPGISKSKPSAEQVAAAKAGYEPTILAGENKDASNAEWQRSQSPSGIALPDQRSRRELAASHYGEPGSPEASKWDAEVRKMAMLEEREKHTAGADKRASIIRRITMIQAGQHEPEEDY